MAYKVSVIVPIYKVEKFIARCAKQLFEQTLPEVEYIFVNDCTPDNSMLELAKTIQAYPHKEHAIRICTHEVNKGLPSARNTGLQHAQGEFIFHCD